jgi:hypothetical protein
MTDDWPDNMRMRLVHAAFYAEHGGMAKWDQAPPCEKIRLARIVDCVIMASREASPHMTKAASRVWQEWRNGGSHISAELVWKAMHESIYEQPLDLWVAA